jgi:Na+-translocating ferredoxin:NAD+ oxidoreductase RnfC subunit
LTKVNGLKTSNICIYYFLTFIEKTTRAEWRKKTKNRERMERKKWRMEKEKKNGNRSPTGKEKKETNRKERDKQIVD